MKRAGRSDKKHKKQPPGGQTTRQPAAITGMTRNRLLAERSALLQACEEVDYARSHGWRDVDRERAERRLSEALSLVRCGQ